MPNQNQAKKIGDIIARWRLSNGWQLLNADDQTITVAGWFQVLELQGVPEEAYDACYQSAIITRGIKRAQGQDVPFTLSAEAVASEWPRLKEKAEKANPGPRMLVANNLGTCQRCFGTGQEQMPDGSVRPGCTHEPLTEYDVAIRAEGKAAAIQFIRDGAKMIFPKPILRAKPAPDKSHVRFQCTACGRRVNGAAGWQLGEECKQLVNAVKCIGEMRVSDEAVYARV